ncbi:MAG TPA: hypothetical protein VEH31_28260 [Streptosporangiaceae bacterium]|nr:hypothetical protein [Streptosporangiaceae bacterium]
MTTATAAVRARAAGRPLAGWVCAAGGVVGAASGLITAFVTPAVSMDMYRYPFSPSGYTAAQIIHAANHLMLLAGLLGIGRVRAARGPSWVTGAAFGAFGLLLLTGCEIWALRLTNTAVDGPQSGPLNTAYGVATIVSGVGLILAGIAVVRTGRWRGWARWTPLALGVLVFVMVIPGLFGTFLEARLAITAWMLAWTALGVALLLDPGEIFLIRRRHLRQLRLRRHR